MTTDAVDTPVRVNRWRWLPAALLALASHGIWFFAFDPISRPTPRDLGEQRVPWRLVVWTEASGKPDWLEALSSFGPAVISLPTSSGFSHPLMDMEIAVRPPLDSPATMNMMLNRDAHGTAYESPRVIPPATWAHVRGHAPADPALALPPVSRPGSALRSPVSSASIVPHIELIDGAGDRLMEPWVPAPGASLWGGAPWSVDVMLDVDARGVVQRALLESRAPQAVVNQHIMRSALAWRWTPNTEPMHVRVRLNYPGVPVWTETEAP